MKHQLNPLYWLGVAAAVIKFSIMPVRIMHCRKAVFSSTGYSSTLGPGYTRLHIFGIPVMWWQRTKPWQPGD